MYSVGRNFDACRREEGHHEDIHEGMGAGYQWRVRPDGTILTLSHGNTGRPKPPPNETPARQHDRKYDPVMLPEPEHGPSDESRAA